METTITALTGSFVFMLGAVIGSFLNVCIHRMPKDESIVSPGSHCPGCNKPISPADNIPLVSYLLLGGKCRHCKEKISPRYFAVELSNAVSWICLLKIFGLTPFFYAGAVLFSILLAVTVTDFETGLIPDKLSLPGMLAGVAMSAVWPVLQGETVWYWGLAQSAAGLLCGGAILLVVGLLGNFFFKKDSMGGGDIKLLAMMGAFMGFKKALLIFFISPFFALPIALFMRYVQKQETIPFGPYLALAGICSFLYGNSLIAWVLKIYGVSNA